MERHIQRSAYRGPIEAVILDWAGTAVDHGCVGPVAVFTEVFGRRGVQVTTAEARRPMGLKKKDHVRRMCEDPGVIAKWRTVYGCEPSSQDVEAMYAEVEPLMRATVAAHADLVPGLAATLTVLRRAGLRIGSTTGYTAPMMEILVPEAFRRGYAPDVVVCSSDVPAGRPCPWMCYLNAIRLQVYPLEAIVKIGDTVADIQEGLNAGMWTIGVTRTGNELGLSEAEAAALPSVELEVRLRAIEAKLRQAGAHYVAESIAECPPLIAEINARLARGERP
jgi:phosphonoacetaldehyde hydrolase